MILSSKSLPPRFVPEEFDRFSNFNQILRWRADNEPSKLAYTFLVDGEDEEETITFGELERYAGNIAAAIRNVVEPGARALLVYDSSIEYIAAIMGCFTAGVVAVPIYPPDPWRYQTTMERFEAVIENSQSSIVLSTSHYSEWTEGLLDANANLKAAITTDTIDRHADLYLPEHNPDTDSPAMLQYTSGSTGTPKGVVITHRNLLANATILQRFNSDDAVAVSWLPMYHDMGLMGLVLQTAFVGRPLVLMAPLKFVERPFRWLRAVSKHRASVTSGPDFAYDLCTQKVSDAELAQLDLSSLNWAITGSEIVRDETLRRFTDRFSACGFDPKAFCPSYGLAEATLFVSGGEKGELPVTRNLRIEPSNSSENTTGGSANDEINSIVGCGSVPHGVVAKVVDPDSRVVCDNGQIGEVWISGDSIAKGYWNRPELTQAKFGAYTSDTEEGPFFRTGDLAFFEGEELFIAGRIKDLIVIRGRNYFPHDIERTILNCDPTLRSNECVAFSIEQDNQEKLVVVQTLRRSRKLDMDELVEKIRKSVLAAHQISPHSIVLIKRGIPKTSSGKTRRSACKALFQAGELVALKKWTANKSSPRADQNGHSNGRPIESNGETRATRVTPAISIHTVTEGNRDALFEYLRNLVLYIKDDISPDRIRPDSFLIADLGLESIELVAMFSQIESSLGRRFAMEGFLAVIGQRMSRDAKVNELLDFLLSGPSTQSPDASTLPVDSQNYVTSRGLRFFYRQDGDHGPEVVLIHGVGGNLSSWYLCGLIRELAKDFRVTTYDLRGHGQSDVPPSGYSSREMAKDLNGILKALGIQKPMLLGHSYGASIALHTAVEFPESVAGVVLSDAYLPGLKNIHGTVDQWLGWNRYQAIGQHIGFEVSREWDDLAPLFEHVANFSPAQQEKFLEIADRSTMQRLARLSKTTCGLDIKSTDGLTAEDILGVRSPVTCLYGESSPFLPLSKFLEQQLPNCRQVIVSGAEHFGFEENPKEYVAMAVQSLAELSGITVSSDPQSPQDWVKRQQTIFGETP
ncbi:alpha/beta fold hydrolase [Pirellulaceae bacterium]|nr:alpha/beta fold hydrolase [Pirellulaceae bacterium]